MSKKVAKIVRSERDYSVKRKWWQVLLAEWPQKTVTVGTFEYEAEDE